MRNHKLEEIEKLKEELEDFNRKKEIAIESGKEINLNDSNSLQYKPKDMSVERFNEIN